MTNIRDQEIQIKDLDISQLILTSWDAQKDPRDSQA